MEDGWSLLELPDTPSTNLVAAKLGPWQAVRADRQSAGRGRFQRSWVSDAGGLWLSAVIPTGPISNLKSQISNAPQAQWRALPLAVGLAVCDALQEAGLRRHRVRWPNDILVDRRKLAGLLVDQFVPGLAVAGIGINVFNHPENSDPALKNYTVRLADLIPSPPDPPDLPDLTNMVLRHLRQVTGQMAAEGFTSLLPRINTLWDGPRRVELDLDGELRRGTFTGVGEEGELLLLSDSGTTTAYQAHQVRHLTEIF
jgi:BirA family biotin operon repressor/biotin-[acetyl-CoA-carboxylase] ligase